MKKAETVNTFNKGLVSDFNPVMTPENVMTNCLNGTILTFNGNENVLQNDMGNGRVETAYLPEGYIPLGTTELGGIIYIVSYNPSKDKCQIGSFPSPERNLETDDVGKPLLLDCNNFYDTDGLLKTDKIRLLLNEDHQQLRAGDKFLIRINGITTNSKEEPIKGNAQYISAYNPDKYYPDIDPRWIKFRVVSIEESGKITDLTNSLVWNDNYYLYEDSDTGLSKDIDEYRNLITSNYNIYNSKINGQLAILAELECVTNFDVAYELYKNGKNYNIYLLTNWEYENEVDRSKVNLYSVQYEISNVSFEVKNKFSTDIEIIKKPLLCNSIIINNYPQKDQVYEGEKKLDNSIIGDSTRSKEFYTPKYVDISTTEENKISTLYKDNSTILRKNDGSDNQFVISTPITVYADEDEHKVTITPGMEFGFMPWMSRTFSIDFSKVGTGEIELTEYKYFYSEKAITLNWGLNAYPEPHKKINGVIFSFWRIGEKGIPNEKDEYNEDSVYDIIKEEDASIIQEGKAMKQITALAKYINKSYEVPTQSSYSGNFTESISFLEPDDLYFVEIKVDYSGGAKYFYRFLYTCSIFNPYYNSKIDFRTISFDDAVESSVTSTLELNETDVTIDSKLYKLDKTETGAETETETDNIPQYYLKDDSSTQPVEVDYKAVYYYKSKIDPKINCTCTYKGIEKTEKLQEGVTFTPTSILDNTGLTQLDYEGNQSKSTASYDVECVDLECESSELSCKFKFPMHINYPTDTTINAEYKLENLTIKPLYLIAYVENEDDFKGSPVTLSITNEFGNPLEIGLATTTTSDQANKEATLNKGYTELETYLKSILDNYDVVMLLCYKYMDEWGDGKNPQDGLMCLGPYLPRGSWGDGSSILYNINLSTPSIAFYHNEKTEGYSENYSAPVLFATKDYNDNINLFTFVFPHTGKGTPSTGDWKYYGITLQDYIDEYTSIESGKIRIWDNHKQYPVFHKNKSDDISNSQKVFDIYKKCVEDNTSYEIWRWSTLIYHDIRKQGIEIKPNNTNVTNTYKIGGQSIIGCDDDDSYKKAIYNIRYKQTSEFTKTGVISRTIDPSKYKNALLKPTTSSSRVNIDGKLIELTISPNKIYGKHPNQSELVELPYFKYPTGDTEQDKTYIKMPSRNTNYSIKVAENTLRVNLNDSIKNTIVFQTGIEDTQFRILDIHSIEIK